MTQSDRRDREIEILQERLSQPSEASRRINETLEFDLVLRGVLGSARYGVINRRGRVRPTRGLCDLIRQGRLDKSQGPC